MTDTTTPVEAPTPDWDGILDRAWEVHNEAEKNITRYAMHIIAEMIQGLIDSAEGIKATGRVRLAWEESASWEVEVETDTSPEFVDIDDLAAEGYPSDDLADYTAHFWETSPSRLEAYAEDIDRDRTYGMLDRATFMLGRMLAGPRTGAEQEEA